MFNIGPLELMVLAIVALVILGPDKLPGFARDAAQMLKTLRELATGARQQLRDELGPEFADVDFRNLNPRTAITRAVFGDEPPDLQKYNPRNFDLRESARGFMSDDPGTDDTMDAGDVSEKLGSAPISMNKAASGAGASTGWSDAAGGHARANGGSPNGASRPRPRPRPAAPPAGDFDAT